MTTAPKTCDRIHPIKLDTETTRRLAVRADVDPRTITRVAAGENVRGIAGRRAAMALVEAGLVRPLPSELAGGQQVKEAAPAKDGVGESSADRGAAKK
jgi:hypothetical protein